jgi:hypothetical protein
MGNVGMPTLGKLISYKIFILLLKRVKALAFFEAMDYKEFVDIEDKRRGREALGHRHHKSKGRRR